jgi:RES domain.
MNYLPLQYISDFIKSSKIGFSGIMYKSVMNNNAVNLVLFDSNLAQCVSVNKQKIKEVVYRFT